MQIPCSKFPPQFLTASHFFVTLMAFFYFHTCTVSFHSFPTHLPPFVNSLTHSLCLSPLYFLFHSSLFALCFLTACGFSATLPHLHQSLTFLSLSLSFLTPPLSRYLCPFPLPPFSFHLPLLHSLLHLTHQFTSSCLFHHTRCIAHSPSSTLLLFSHPSLFLLYILPNPFLPHHHVHNHLHSPEKIDWLI